MSRNVFVVIITVFGGVISSVMAINELNGNVKRIRGVFSERSASPKSNQRHVANNTGPPFLCLK